MKHKKDKKKQHLFLKYNINNFEAKFLIVKFTKK